MKFIYRSGQRPLDGYTIKRGIGRGGFGEVYYAVSDGGKDVALKLIHGGNSEAELRGMAQCLNLKHPHLVSLYDLRTDAQGDHWVVMEYIAGEPLSMVLTRHPQGLPAELADQWFLAIAKAVACLHDHGIVHRDLKPANIFVENGLIKIGDYGLSKFISCSQRTAQTQSVGTVHYMAPEISTGNYNKQIDIYASGVILYEMLSGRVPFDGESAGEILMKHLTSPPDLTKLPEAYVSIVGKALAKNPAHRFANMSEMAKAVEGVGGRQPAGAVAAPVPAPAAIPPAISQPVPVKPSHKLEPAATVLPAGPSVAGQIAELSSSLVLSALLALVATVLWTAIGKDEVLTANNAGQILFLTVAVCWAVIIPAKFWTRTRGDAWGRRLVMLVLGGLVGAALIWLDGWRLRTPDREAAYAGEIIVEIWSSIRNNSGQPPWAALGYFALGLFALRWWKLADRRRSHRFSFAPVLAAAFWGGVLLLVWQDPWRGPLVLTTTAAIVQLVSPWEQPPPPLARRMRLRYS